MTMQNVVSNIAPTIMGFLTTLPKFHQDMNYVYEDTLDYTKALSKFRLDNQKLPQDTTYPIMVFKRSNLRYTEHGIGRRAVSNKIMFENPSNLESFKTVWGEVDIEFAVFTPDTDHLENFEISYLSEVGQAKQKKFSYMISNLGTFDFFVSYEPLSNISLSNEQVIWKSASGKATMRGFFFVAIGTSSIIQEIQADLLDLSTGKNLTSIVITP